MSEQTPSAPKQLILLDAGIKLHRWVDFARRIDSDGASLVIADARHNLARMDDLNVRVQTVAEHALPSGTTDGKIWSDACDLVRMWGDQLSQSKYAQAIEYEGLALWEMGSYEIGNAVRAIVKRIEALRDVLAGGEWRRVYSLENQQTLWEAFRIAAADVGFSGDVQRVSMRRDSVLYRCLYRRMVSSRNSQIVKDVYYGLRSCPRPRSFGLRRKSDSRPYLFLLNSYRTYLFTLLPVINEIGSIHKVLALNTVGVIRADGLRERGIGLSYCSQYVPFSARWRIAKRTRELWRVWCDLQNDVHLTTLFKYRGHSLWPALRHRLREHFLGLFPRVMVWTEALKHIFESACPCAVVTVPDRHFPARVALSLARQYNVPSLTIQPALISDHPRYGALYADKVAVMDEHSRRVFVERGGVAPERVIVTGLPRWDSISRVISEARIGSPRTVRQSLGLGVEDRLVVFATQALSPSYTKRMIQATMYALSSHTDAQLVIRLHPRESLETYKSLLAELEWVGREPIMVTDIDLHALLAASDLLVTGFSNVALEAALLDRPVLIVNLAGEPDALPFVQDGIALGAYSEAELKQQLAKALDDSRTIEELQSRRHQYLYHNPQLLDGQSTKRVADLLWQMRNKCDHLDEVL